MGDDNDNVNNILFDACRKAESEVAKFVIKQYPKLVDKLDKENNSPLHISCEKGMDVDTIKLLYKAYPKALRIYNNEGASPFQLTCMKGTCLKTLMFLCGELPEGLSTPSENGDLPIHWINQGITKEMVEYLIKQYPRGSAIKNNDGVYPFHVVCDKGEHMAQMIIHVLDLTKRNHLSNLLCRGVTTGSSFDL